MITSFNNQAPRSDTNSKQFRFSVNCQGQNKDWNKELLTSKFEDKTGTLSDVVDHIKQGHALCAGLLGGQRRNKDNVIGTQWILLDIDNSGETLDENGEKIKGYRHQLTLNEALVHPFVQQYCSLIYTTASHTPAWHKFRLVFLLPQYESDIGTIEAMIRFLMEQFPHDPSCKDASRVFYGNTKAEIPLFNPDVCLPIEWREQAIAAARDEAARKKQQQKQQQLRQAEYERQFEEKGLSQEDTDALALDALRFIPPREPGSGNYNECRTVLMALHSHFGEAEAERIAEQWSPSIPKNTWNIFKKLRSFKRSGVEIGSLFWIAQQYGWRFPDRKTVKHSDEKKHDTPNSGGDSGDRVSKVVEHPTSSSKRPSTIPPVSTISLRDRVLEILSRNHSASERKEAFIELSGSTGRQLRDIEQLAAEIELETELTEGRTERASELVQLQKLSERRLTLSRYLHSTLAQPLEQVAGWMGVDVEALLTILLPTAASLLHPKNRVVVKECIDFSEPLLFYTGIVSESGNRKSPTFKIITKGLRKLQDEEDDRYKALQEQRKQYSKSMDEGEEPPDLPPAPREFFLDNVTSEALDRIKAQQPEHAVLVRKDELSGLFGSYGAYKGGKGSDKEGVLSGWNGDGIKVNRAGGTRLSLSHDATSIAGAIQPGKLRQIMGDLEDEQGEWGRFLWYFSPLRPFKLPDSDTKFEVGKLLEDIFRKLDKLDPQQYKFTPDAQKVYQEWHWKLEQRKCAEPRQGMRAAIAKMLGYTARIAGLLHILWEVVLGGTPSASIPVDRVIAAKSLAEFYLGQVTLIHSDAEAAQGETNPVLNLILNKARQLGQLTTRSAKSGIKALKKIKSEKILEYFKELETLGFATVKGKTLVPKMLTDVDQMLTEMLTTPEVPVTTTIALLQPIVNKNVDHVDSSLEQHPTFTDQEWNAACSEWVPKKSIENSQQSQQVNISPALLTESDVDDVDPWSTNINIGSTFSESESVQDNETLTESDVDDVDPWSTSDFSGSTISPEPGAVVTNQADKTSVPGATSAIPNVVPKLVEGLSAQDKLERLSKRNKTCQKLWYVGVNEKVPRLLTFNRLELWFGEEKVIAHPDGWFSPLRFELSEIEVVAESGGTNNCG